MRAFTIVPCSGGGDFVLIQWTGRNGMRSIQVEREIAELWASAPDQAAEIARLRERNDRCHVACAAALSLLENIGTGKWAKTPAGDLLRAALGEMKREG